jgi:hypothetical protein
MAKVPNFLSRFTSSGLPADIVFNAREGFALQKNLMPFDRSYQVESSRPIIGRGEQQ